MGHAMAVTNPTIIQLPRPGILSLALALFALSFHGRRQWTVKRFDIRCAQDLAVRRTISRQEGERGKA